jgi:uncharacterized protein with GYD domain
MPTYIMLAKWTDQGIKNVKESPQRLDAAKKGIEAAGGKMTGFYLTMGRYDIIAIAEFPSDEVATGFMLNLGSAGSLRTETLKAYPEDQYRNITAKLQ